MTAVTPGSAELLALAKRFDGARHLDCFDEPAVPEMSLAERDLIIAALRLAAKPDDQKPYQPDDGLLPCPHCKQRPATKVGPPAMARCGTYGCEGYTLAATTLAEWNTRAASQPTHDGAEGAGKRTLEVSRLEYEGWAQASTVSGYWIKALPDNVEVGVMNGDLRKLSETTHEIAAAPPKPAPDMREADNDRLITTMAFAMQGAQFALQNGRALDVALSSLTIALQIEADHWQKYARLSAPVPPADGANELSKKLQGEIDFSDKFNGIAKIPVELLQKCVAALLLSPSPAVAAEPVAWTVRRPAKPADEDYSADMYWEVLLPDGTWDQCIATNADDARKTMQESWAEKEPAVFLPPVRGDREALRWYLACQNDGLFIINAEPRPSNDDQWHDRPNGPSIVLNVTELPEAKAIKIVGVMNDLSLPVQPGADERGSDAAEADRYFDMAGEFGHQLQSLAGVVQDAVDILAERKQGNAARSPGHNARVILETALKKVSPSALSRQAPHSSSETES